MIQRYKPILQGWWLIETWDVLKSNSLPSSGPSVSINRNMRCIEITLPRFLSASGSMININMRCIEMLISFAMLKFAFGLIETWDVLKSKTMADMEVATKINRNMRCIEMELNTPELPQDETINRNMRCIEIRNGSGRAESGNMIHRNMRCIEIRRWALPWCCQRRLIETWDVLKYTVLLPDLIQRERLIETWDVLKFKAAALLRCVVPD